jgi:hypothetical protein
VSKWLSWPVVREVAWGAKELVDGTEAGEDKMEMDATKWECEMGFRFGRSTSAVCCRNAVVRANSYCASCSARTLDGGDRNTPVLRCAGRLACCNTTLTARQHQIWTK